jgi:lipopolysaccharide/colanic/teichoic acid biosynthesis glycosyltransferase
MEKIFFVQDRVGADGVLFQTYKIQTMYPDAAPTQDLVDFWIKNWNDLRIIPSRKWLRNIWIDEVPQIINIIIGDMNIFGARPVIPDIFSTFTDSKKDRYTRSKPWVIWAYLFQENSKDPNWNLRKANDAYLRLCFLKRNDPLWIILMNILALRKSIVAILQWRHQ